MFEAMACLHWTLFLLVLATINGPSLQSGTSTTTGDNCIRNCHGRANGDYQSCRGCNVYATCSNGILYDNRPCPATLVWEDSADKKRCEYVSPTCNFMVIYSSCFDAYSQTGDMADGEYAIDGGGGIYTVFCDFQLQRIYTYIAKTDITTLNIDNLYNNRREILIRHKRTDGIQYEVTYGQITMFTNTNLSIQYNSSMNYNPIQNDAMFPYVYVGLLETDDVIVGQINGYRANNVDYVFNNCDGNQNNYFTTLFNGANAATTGRVVDDETYMSRWKTEATPTTFDIDDKFFVQYEVHFGGCGGYLTSDHLPDVVGVTFGLCYDLTFSSCFDVYNRTNNPEDGEYVIDDGSGTTFIVYCEFFSNRIYTYIAKTDITTLNIDNLYNNEREILIRHKRTDGIQYEVTYGQINMFDDIDISIQYNSSTDYNPIQNDAMFPYIYVGLLNTSEVSVGQTNGYSVDGVDYVFNNCDGNPNNYFALLFNAANAATTGRGVGRQTYMSRWKTEATPVSADRNIDDKFFVQYEVHFGGCGGFLTSDHLSDVVGVTFGLCYDLTFSSCFDVYNQVENPEDGEYLIDTGSGESFYVYCEFFSNRIYTYIAKTDITTLNIDNLYNNRREILIRHKRTDGIQYEVTYGQINMFDDIDISIQYNSSTDYNPIQNDAMFPYVYVGLLNTSEVSVGQTNGYSVDGVDYVFNNCDGNPNNYFALLFNGANAATTGRAVGRQTYMSRWKTEATPVSADRNLDDRFFVQYEVHFGGCGGFLTSDHLSDVVGVTFGLCYDL